MTLSTMVGEALPVWMVGELVQGVVDGFLHADLGFGEVGCDMGVWLNG